MLDLWKKNYDKPKQHIKKQRHQFDNKCLSSWSYGFPVVMYWRESWTIKKPEHWRIDAFELWCWRRLLRVPWTARSNQLILKEINPEYYDWTTKSTQQHHWIPAKFESGPAFSGLCHSISPVSWVLTNSITLYWHLSFPGQAEEPANVAPWTLWSQFLFAFQHASVLFMFLNVEALCGKLH